MLRGAVSGADEASRWPADGAPVQVVRWSLAGQAMHERRRAAGQSHTEFGIADLAYAWRHVEAQIGWSAVLAGWHVEEFEAAPTRPSEPHLEAAALERGICGPEAL